MSSFLTVVKNRYMLCSGVCEISQKEIAKEIGISQSLVSKCLRRLERIDKCIEKIKPGVYKINHTDMKIYGPYSIFIRYNESAIKDSSFISMKAKERADIINGCEEDIIMCVQYFNILVNRMDVFKV